MKLLKNLLRDNKGAATTEYALLLALVGIAVITAIVLMRQELTDTFVRIADALQGTDSNGTSQPGGTHARPRLN